jgi:hypothetical protein
MVAAGGGPVAMKLPTDSTRGVPSSTDVKTVDRFTQEATDLNLRVGQLAVRFLKAMDGR